MPERTAPIVVDDRLLIEELLVGLSAAGRHDELRLCTTSYWYYRACRAAVIGAGGRLSGPFRMLDAERQRRAILSLLELPDKIGLADPRRTVPAMADLAHGHPYLNVMNLEAVAVGRVFEATLWLSPASAAGVLPGVLDAEGIAWTTVALAVD